MSDSGPWSMTIETLERRVEALGHALAREAMRRETYRTTLAALVREMGGLDGPWSETLAMAKEVLEWDT